MDEADKAYEWQCAMSWLDEMGVARADGQGRPLLSVAGRIKKLYTDLKLGRSNEPRRKQVYVGAPAVFILEQCCQHLNQAFGGFHCYLVGSVLERPDWRDVDVRYILSDEDFASLFPDAGEHWEGDPRWLLLTVAISKWLSSQTGLPVDFQFQPQTHANERHKGPRSALGLSTAKRSK